MKLKKNRTHIEEMFRGYQSLWKIYKHHGHTVKNTEETVEFAGRAFFRFQ